MKPLALEPKLWENLRSAYGNECEIIDILNKLYITKDEKQWLHIFLEELADNAQIVHQGTFYDITVAVMPHIVFMLTNNEWSNNTRYKIISYIGYFISCENREIIEKLPEDIQKNYKKSLKILETITQDIVENFDKSFQIEFDEELSYFALACFAILKDKIVANLLQFIDIEIEFVCGSCSDGAEEFFSFIDDIESNNENLKLIKPSTVQTSTDDNFLWFYNFLINIGEKKLSKTLPYYYGTYTCPKCGEKAIVINLMKNS